MVNEIFVETISPGSDNPLATGGSETQWLERVQFRFLNEKDLPQLEWDGEYLHFRRLYRDIFHSVCQGNALMWGCELPERGIIGQVFIQLRSTRLELADGYSRAYLYGFRIRPAYRNAGLGTRLLLLVEKDLLERNYKWSTLNVSRCNLAARRFYERHAYRVIADEPGEWSYIDHEGRRCHVREPAWRMEKYLAGSFTLDVKEK